MSTIDSEDRNVTGYFLPEDTQLRLKQLREYVGFLTNLARPRRPDEDSECYNEIRPGEVAICFELIEEQIGLVLDELSWPGERGESADAPSAAAETEKQAEASDTDAEKPYGTEPASEEAGNRWIAGVSLGQIDEIHLLLDSLRAHGNVVASSDEAKLKDVTLSIMGDAICRDAQKLRDIVDAIYDDQRLQPRASKSGVREEHATYFALPASMTTGTAPPILRPHPTYQ
ncbi:MAG: XAC0095 family protein [Dyella sp.]|uniref:XAC0095 family protein n=1 Tax=Dyella sp. TaxID=1869338 RepID=UPI003F7E7B09